MKQYDDLIKETREITILGSINHVLGWDEQTHLPPAGGELRADQQSMLAKMCHERFTAPKIGEWIAAIESSDLVKIPESDPAANIRQWRREYDRATKIPASLVEEMARVSVLSQQAWIDARKKSDYPAFEPWLKKVIDLKKREAECVGWKEHIYDALLDPFEPDETTANIRRVFESLREPLIELIGKIKSSGKKAPTEILERKFPQDLQEKFAISGAKAIGFDFNAGRLDISVHPFCSSIGPGDTRITTRYDERSFVDAFFGVMHETGHGLYEQGLPKKDHFGEPIAEAISLGIHESQSRFWENLVARSRSYWKHFLPKAKEIFGSTLADVSERDWYWAINDVRPDFIRVEADETTYNLHVLIRFEMEQAMMTGEVSTSDIPALWNEKMKKYLGLTPPDDARGCLQDIHWSFGGIGYFPTYTLGNLYAAQWFEQARQDLGDLDAMFARGEFMPLLSWLREKIHRHGKRYTSAELVKRITGKPLSAEPLLRHLRAKAADLYGVT